MFRRGRKGHDAEEMSIHTKTVINNAQRRTEVSVLARYIIDKDLLKASLKPCL